MEETFDYIESYFQDQLDGDQRRLFEQRCISDESFAADVALYVSSREAVREKLLEQKKAEWASWGTGAAPVRVLRATRVRRSLFLAGAAAALLAAVIVWFFAQPLSPQRSAEKYIAENYAQLSATMDGSMDSLQQAILAYNKKDYVKASSLFESISIAHPEKTDAWKYAGVVYLVTGKFDQALEKFRALAQMRGLLNNPGSFLQAVTLLERNAPGDKDQAKQLLETVVREQLEGSGDAAAWLKKYW